MKQCNNYEDAIHTDCMFCDEECKFRKNHNILVLIPLIIAIICIIILILL